MQKNVASQKAVFFAFDSTTNLPKTGDAANITPYESLDWGSVTAITDTSMTEMDSTNAKGYYVCDLTQAETNANMILFSAKSSTSNIVVVGAPAMVQTVPANFTATSIDSNGRVDVIKIAGTTQTARDIGASVLLSSGTGTGQIKIASGYVAMTWADIAAPTTTVNLSGTTIKAVTDAVTFPASATINITGNITGNLSGSVGSVTGAVGSVTGAVGSVTGNVGGNVAGSVGSVTGDIGGLAAGAITDVEDAVWDASLAAHQDVGSTGEALGNASSAGDPWGTALPGAYASGTAGFILGTNLNATITSRMATYTQPTGFLTATFPATVASTTNITSASGVTLSATGSAAMTEGYRANGATGTLNQLLYEVIAHLGESSIVTTTKTIKKLDHSTTAETFSLDDATTPTSITRAT